MNEFCKNCALIAASLLALGASPTPEQVHHARVSLCQAAAYPRADGDALLDAAYQTFGGDDYALASNAIGRALFEYMNGEWKDCGNPEVNKRLSDLLHAPHEGEMGSGS